MDIQKLVSEGKGLYFGHLIQNEPQFHSGEFIGLSLAPRHDREIKHDLYEPLPVKDGTVSKIQSQDVFEHLEYETLPDLLNEVFRALCLGGIFRLSVPDYRSPVLTARSVYDVAGNVIADIVMGNTPKPNKDRTGIAVENVGGGGAHLWFPTYEKVLELIVRSEIRKSSKIEFHHCFKTKSDFIKNEFKDLGMPVSRRPPVDMRAGGKPISIIVDFVK